MKSVSSAAKQKSAVSERLTAFDISPLYCWGGELKDLKREVLRRVHTSVPFNVSFCAFILFARRCIRRVHKASSKRTLNTVDAWLTGSLSACQPVCWLAYVAVRVAKFFVCNTIHNTVQHTHRTVRPRMPSSAGRRNTNVTALDSHNSFFPIFIRRVFAFMH